MMLSSPFITQNTLPPSPNLSLSANHVRKELKKIKVKKAAGPDDISSRLLKPCVDQLCGTVEHVFNLSLKLGSFTTMENLLRGASAKDAAPKGPQQIQASCADIPPDEDTGTTGACPSPPSGETIH